MLLKLIPCNLMFSFQSISLSVIFEWFFCFSLVCVSLLNINSHRFNNFLFIISLCKIKRWRLCYKIRDWSILEIYCDIPDNWLNLLFFPFSGRHSHRQRALQALPHARGPPASCLQPGAERDHQPLRDRRRRQLNRCQPLPGGVERAAGGAGTERWVCLQALWASTPVCREVMNPRCWCANCMQRVSLKFKNQMC